MIMLLFVVSLLALALSAFCSGAETAFLSVSRERILHIAREGGRKAKLVENALADMGWTTATILIGNNIANVVYSTTSTAIIVALCAGAWRSIWSFLAAFIVLYVSEFLPKMLCSARPLRRILMLAPFYTFLATLLKPFTAAAMWITGIFLPNKTDNKYKLTSADLMRILEDRKDGVCLSDIESALISRILVLRLKRKQITAEALLSALREEA
ncbi:MAG: DUF21 domain-containing protein [Kiritimatiellae bacterium]|nr:DUF21 domain-containing protein [Kiritimatiellia bacterium]